MRRILNCVALVFGTVLVLMPVLYVYRVIFQIEYSVIAASGCAICSFPVFITLSRHGKSELKKQERLLVAGSERTASDNRILALCLMYASPLYLAMLIVAFIPVVKAGMLLLTSFPAIVMCIFPAAEICNTYENFTGKRRSFWCIHITLSIVLSLIGHITLRLLIAA